jgi:hypothetical protein
MTNTTPVYEQMQNLYRAVHSAEAPVEGEQYVTQKGQHEAIWDALLLLAARIDGDEERDPRAERTFEEGEFDTF